MGEQGGLDADGRREFAADATGMGLEAGGSLDARDESFHPRTVALALARIPVGVEGTEKQPVTVAHFVAADIGMPQGHALEARHFDPVKLLHDGEHAVDHALSGEVGAELFFVEIVERTALLFRPVANVPGLQFLPGEGFQCRIFLCKEGLGLFLQIFHELHGSGAFVGHAVVQDEVGKIGKTEEGGFLFAEVEDLGDERAVVASGLGGAGGEGAVHFFADGPVVEISEHRNVAGRLQGEAPTGKVFCFGGLTACGARALGTTRELLLIGGDQFERVGGIENVFGIFGGDLRQLDVDFGETLLTGFVEIRTMATERIERFGEETETRAGECLRLIRLSEAFELLPQAVIQGDARIELAGFAFHGVPGGAEFGTGIHRLEVAHYAEGIIQHLGGAFEGQHSVLVGAGRGIVNDGVDVGLGALQEFAHAGFNVFSADLIERDLEADLEEGIFLHGGMNFYYRRGEMAMETGAVRDQLK